MTSRTRDLRGANHVSKRAAATSASSRGANSARVPKRQPAPVPPQSPAPAALPSAAAYIATKLRVLDAELAKTIPRVIASSDDEAIHDMRVAIRRLRTLLKMSRRVYGRFHADAVRAAFADVQRATGELRDEEVLDETLDGLSHHPTFAAWVRTRRARERRLRRDVVARLERGELTRARKLLDALLMFPFQPDRDDSLAKFARRTVQQARRKVDARRDVEADDVTGLHDLRIAYKELRYSIELLSDALPIDARALHEPAVVFQKRLGEIHDVDVAIPIVLAARSVAARPKAEVAAKLHELRQRRIQKYLRELDPMSAAAPPPPPPPPARARPTVERPKTAKKPAQASPPRPRTPQPRKPPSVASKGRGRGHGAR